MVDELIILFKRDLSKIRDEVNKFTNEESLWKNYPGINNCAGNLVLHICGNLQHFVGTVLGNTGYERQRDLEFSRKNVDRSEMLKELDKTIIVVEETLQNLSKEKLEDDYPILFIDKTISTKQLLFHLLGHLNYHLGQINYYRRMNN